MQQKKRFKNKRNLLNLTQAPFLIYLTCTYKNTLITIFSSTTKKKILQISSRSFPIKIKKKNNPYILQKMSFYIIRHLKKMKCKNIKIFINGIGRGRYHIIKYLSKKFKILIITDRTPVPFNGCKNKKQKRR